MSDACSNLEPEKQMWASSCLEYSFNTSEHLSAWLGIAYADQTVGAYKYLETYFCFVLTVLPQ